MIELILNVSFMFSGCLGALDSNGIETMLLTTSTIPSHEYGTATPEFFLTIDDQLLQFLASEYNF